MNHEILEKNLRKQIKKTRLIEAAVCAVSLILLIFFWVGYEQSKVIDELVWGSALVHQSVTYNTDWLWGILPCALILIVSSVFLMCDLIFTRLDTVEVNGSYLTLYRGWSVKLYVDGELKDSLILSGHYLETTLPDRTRVTVSLGKWSAHITFSNGRSPIDL